MLSKWVWLGVDRIEFSAGISDPSVYDFLYAQFWAMRESEMQALLVPAGKITIKPEEYVTHLSYYPTPKKMIARFTLGTTKSKHKYFKLGLLPARFGAGEFETLKETIALLLPEVNYAKLFHTANVSYIELNADSPSHALHTFIPFRAKCNVSFVYKNELAPVGTTYLGSNVSDLRFRVYDKRTHLLETGGVAHFDIHTRIEAIVRHTGVAAYKLPHSLSNPFQKLEIADLHRAHELSKKPDWQAFLAECLASGSAAALSKCKKYQRKKFMTMLRASSAPWWNANFIWQGFPAALSAIAP
jgi:hypothetical protein